MYFYFLPALRAHCILLLLFPRVEMKLGCLGGVLQQTDEAGSGTTRQLMIRRGWSGGGLFVGVNGASFTQLHSDWKPL